MSKYLDKTGLSAFWQKIKDTFAKKSDIPTDYIDLTSDQEIEGTKSFVQRPLLPLDEVSPASTTINYCSLQMASQEKNGVTIYQEGLKLYINGQATGYWTFDNLLSKTIPAGNIVFLVFEYEGGGGTDFGIRLRNSSTLSHAGSQNYIKVTAVDTIDRVQLYGSPGQNYSGVVVNKIEVYDLTEIYGGNENVPTSFSINTLNNITLNNRQAVSVNDLRNYINLTSDQEVNGIKTFIQRPLIKVSTESSVGAATLNDIPDSYTKTESDAKYLPTITFTYNGPGYYTAKSLYDLIIADAPDGQCFLNVNGYRSFSGYIKIRYIGSYQIFLMSFGEKKYISGVYSSTETFDSILDQMITLTTTNDFKTINGQSLIGTGDITISGGGVSGDYLPLSGGTLTGLTNVTEGVEITFGEKEVYSSGSVEYPIVMYSNGCELNMKAYSKSGDYNIKFVTDYPYVEVNECGYYYSQLMPSALRILDTEAENGAFYGMDYIGHGTSSNPSQYKLTFPEESGTIALTSQIPYQHDIYIMPGVSSPTDNVYIRFTLNVKGKSTAYTTPAQVVSALWARNNRRVQDCVMATGKCATSSAAFAGYVVGVYAASETTLGVAYVTTGGTITYTTYAISAFSNMTDKVN